MIQGQLNHSDAAQYIRQLKDHIDELKAEVRHPWVLRHPRPALTGAAGPRTLHPRVPQDSVCCTHGFLGTHILHPWVLGDLYPAPMGAVGPTSYTHKCWGICTQYPRVLGSPTSCTHGCCGTHVLHPRVLQDPVPCTHRCWGIRALHPWVLGDLYPVPMGAMGPPYRVQHPRNVSGTRPWGGG